MQNQNLYELVQLFLCMQEHIPSLRFCQFISIVAYDGGWKDPDTFYCPDDVLLKGLKEFYQKRINGEDKL